MGNSCGCTAGDDEDVQRRAPEARVKRCRACTDVPMLALWIASWIAIVGVFLVAHKRGADPNLLVRGVDTQDRICGVSPGVEDKPLAVWPGVPGQTGLRSVNPITLFSIKTCVSSCDATLSSDVVVSPYPSRKFTFYCLPTKADGFYERFDEGSTYRAFGDLKVSWTLLLASAGAAVVLSLLYASVCRRFVGTMVVVAIVLGVGAVGALCWALLKRSGDDGAQDRRFPPYAYKYDGVFAYGTAGLAALLLSALYAMRRQIRTAVEVVRESAKVITAIPPLLLYPLVPLVGTLLYVAFWICAAVYIFSVQELMRPQQVPAQLRHLVGETYLDRRFDPSMQRAIVYHFFHLFWCMQVFVYFTYLVVAGVIVDWYFTPAGTNGVKKVKSGLVNRWFFNTLVYHLGTVAFGALIIAIIRFVRTVVTYLERKTKARQNRVQRAVYSCVHVCLKGLDCVLGKVSKNAFVFVALYGKAFLPASSAAFALLWRNLARVAAVSAVSHYIVLLGKVLVALLTTAVAYCVLTRTDAFADVSSPTLPTLAVFGLSYVIASLLMIVFEATTDAVFLCFLIDEENNSGRAMFASPSLQNVVNKNMKQSIAIALDMADEYDGRKHRASVVHAAA
ncbi:unnamed protein product (mitochondrion) [Plasmodiophora brassicae]|uniref:Choline transporter-like protein n=1 Tax=Plasmodiophora brassicae TaxID=37360 RepID=A0A3P3Y118_PLABS|nr:unnamed protein product [Plasmodiophora brassicae]